MGAFALFLVDVWLLGRVPFPESLPTWQGQAWVLLYAMVMGVPDVGLFGDVFLLMAYFQELTRSSAVLCVGIPSVFSV